MKSQELTTSKEGEGALGGPLWDCHSGSLASQPTSKVDSEESPQLNCEESPKVNCEESPKLNCEESPKLFTLYSPLTLSWDYLYSAAEESI